MRLSFTLPVALLMAAALLLPACGGGTPEEPVWVKSGASRQERDATIEECVKLAEGERPPQERRERRQVDSLGNVFLKCMKERGWTQKRQ